MVGAHIIRETLRIFKQRRASLIEQLPGFGQAQTTGGTQQQRDAQLIFKLANIKTDNRFR